MKKDLVEKFINDPQWKEMEEFIFNFFDTDIDINSIDTKQSSDVVHAQVIAKQHIDKSVRSLKDSFRAVQGTLAKPKKKSYK